MRAFRQQLMVLALGVIVPMVPLHAATSANSGPTAEAQADAAALARAVNEIRVEASGRIVVENPAHTVVFTSQGMDFRPSRGPAWRWQLRHIGDDSTTATGDRPRATAPAHTAPGLIDFDRGDVTERYVVKANTVEQQFILERKPQLGGGDLLVEGRVETDGTLQAAGTHGWVWRNALGRVSLGDVTVFDAAGRTLPATMTVSQNATQIRVDGNALALARYPVTIDPEVGTDDFQVSNPGGGVFDSGEAAVAYNATSNQYAVVWWGDNVTTGDNNFAIFLKILNASDGTTVLAETIIGDNASNLTLQDAPRFPDIAWNAFNNEYLVVWRADDGTGVKEIYGQLLNASGGEIGPDDFQISNMSNAGSDRDADFPAVAHNTATNQYLVVWQGDRGLTNDDRDIFGQVVAANGGVVLDDFQISEVGAAGATDEKAADADVAYSPVDNQFLVVWEQDVAVGAPFVSEIYGQLLDADGSTVLKNDFLISQSGGTSFDAKAPSVAANAGNGDYLVAWFGDHDTIDGDAVNNANEVFQIYAQRLNGAGAELGADFRVSNVAVPNSDPEPRPGVAYNPANDDYLVAWPGSVFGERIAADGSVAEEDFQFSDDAVVGAAPTESKPLAAVAHNAAQNEYLALWVADPGATGQNAVFGQRFAGPATLRFTDTSPSVGEGAGMATITVNRVGDTTPQVTVDVSSSDGTAMAPADYTVVSSTLTFLTAETSATFDVAVVDDTAVEGDETVGLALSNAQGGAVLDAVNANAVLTINDDDVNLAPVADAGADQTVAGGAMVTLDGTNSSDPNSEDTISHAWTQIGGPAVTLADANTDTASFTAPAASTLLTFQLTVTDSGSLTGTDTVTITVTGSGGTAPVANAGDDRTVDFGDTVTLDGTGSTDPNGDQLTYAWTQTSGDNVTLNGAGTATPNFTAPSTEQDLVFQLTVSDGTEVAVDTVTISVREGGGGGGGGGSSGFSLDLYSLLLFGTVAAVVRRRRRNAAVSG